MQMKFLATGSAVLLLCAAMAAQASPGKPQSPKQAPAAPPAGQQATPPTQTSPTPQTFPDDTAAHPDAQGTPASQKPESDVDQSVTAVVPHPESAPAITDDTAARVQERILKRLPTSNISVTANNNQLVLAGNVTDPAQKELAGVLAEAATPGAAVQNNIVVLNPAPTTAPN
jgi:hypothetical protein